MSDKCRRTMVDSMSLIEVTAACMSPTKSRRISASISAFLACAGAFSAAQAADWACIPGGTCRDLTVGTGPAATLGVYARAQVGIWTLNPSAPDLKGAPVSVTTYDRGYQVLPVKGPSVPAAVSGAIIGMRVGGHRRTVIERLRMVVEIDLHEVVPQLADLQAHGFVAVVQIPPPMVGWTPGPAPGQATPTGRIDLLTTANGTRLVSTDAGSIARMNQSAGAILQILKNANKPVPAQPQPANPSSP